MDQQNIWKIFEGDGPIVSTAIHNGHLVRKEVDELLKLDDAVRLMEEDPFTEELTVVGDTRIIGLNSRFEVDLNRPREKAVYKNPDDAWGLDLWKEKPTQEFINISLSEYDSFYAEAHRIFSNLKQKHKHFVVLDLHTYNHLRDGSDGPSADPEMNPEVNIGTGSMNREIWSPIVDSFLNDIRKYDFNGRYLDVRENVKFKGGQFSRWIHQTFPDSACSLSIEFKKFFMDEWTGIPDRQQLDEIRSALQSTIPGILHELKRMSK